MIQSFSHFFDAPLVNLILGLFLTRLHEVVSMVCNLYYKKGLFVFQRKKIVVGKSYHLNVNKQPTNGLCLLSFAPTSHS